MPPTATEDKVKVARLEERLDNTIKTVEGLNENIKETEGRLSTQIKESQKELSGLISQAFKDIREDVEDFQSANVKSGTEQDVKIATLHTRQKIFLWISGILTAALLSGLIRLFFFSGQN